MPVIAIEPGSKKDLPYSYPSTGKIKLYLESSIPVDIYIATAAQLIHTVSPASAAANNIYILQSQQKVDNLLLNMPPSWSNQTWYLVLGNPSAATAAVYYTVYTA